MKGIIIGCCILCIVGMCIIALLYLINLITEYRMNKKHKWKYWLIEDGSVDIDNLQQFIDENNLKIKIIVYRGQELIWNLTASHPYKQNRGNYSIMINCKTLKQNKDAIRISETNSWL